MTSCQVDDLDRLRLRYQACEQKGQELAARSEIISDRFALEKSALVASKGDALWLMEQELKAAKEPICLLAQDAGEYETVSERLFRSVKRMEEYTSSWKSTIDTNSALIIELRSAYGIIDDLVKEFNESRAKLLETNHFQLLPTTSSALDLVSQAHGEIANLQQTVSELEYNVSELEESLEEGQNEIAQYYQCAKCLEDEVLELQAEREEAIEALKRSVDCYSSG
jgi:chromosome segregation ATPase